MRASHSGVMMLVRLLASCKGKHCDAGDGLI